MQKEVQEAKNTLFGMRPTPDDPIIFDVLTKLYQSGVEDGFTQGKDESCLDCEQQGNDAGYERGFEDGKRSEGATA